MSENKDIRSSSQKPENLQKSVQTKTVQRKKKIDPKKRRNRKIKQYLILTMLVTLVVVVILSVINLVRVVRTSSSNSGGTTTSLSTDTQKTMSNDLYEIGNNPTNAQKTYFKNLTEAVQSGSDAEVIQSVVECFVADYFTWTNKDGNYEIGGLQYVYPDKEKELEEYSRYNFYADLDLYITKYGRDKLLQVKEITCDVEPTAIADFDLIAWDPPMTFRAYTLHVNWTYESSTSLNVNEFPQGAYFIVINNNDRWEVCEFYTDNEIDYIN